MKPLELLDSGEISVEWPGVGSTVHAGQVGRLIVGPGIGIGACRRRGGRDVAKGVEEVRQFIGHTVLLQVRNVIASVVDTPLFEVSSQDFFMVMILCKRGWDACSEDQQSQQRSSEQAGEG